MVDDVAKTSVLQLSITVHFAWDYRYIRISYTSVAKFAHNRFFTRENRRGNLREHFTVSS